MSDQPKPIVICAQQRSGTTVLQENLGQSPLVTNYSEVFHNLEEISPVNYLLFRIEQFKDSPELSFPSKENQETLFKRYMEYLTSKCDTPFYVMDIKYNSWHHFDSIWHGQMSRPDLLSFIRFEKMPVMHVIRNDVFRQHVSNRFAEQTKTWHYFSEEDKKPKKLAIRIDPTQCQYGMEMSQRRTEQFRAWFHGHENYVELTYEDMFDNGSFSEGTLNSINDLVGADLCIPRKPVLKKVMTSVAKNISNRDEVIQYFAGTRFEEMVGSSLGA